MQYTLVTPKEASAQQQNGALIIDIRQADEFRREHLPDARSLPLDTLLAGQTITQVSPGQTVIFHCQSGMRTQQNAEALVRAAAPANVMILEGGLNNWKREKLPTVQDKRQPRPLMQQVQIVAGSLILLGVVLGFTLHPNFFLLSGFVGAGLLFAGLSGWCGMALLLAKMPWNRS
ncbi:rhodanese family protein [Kosakonia pseudosacchari]|uniref:rhodanese family protein n=1 Tax=Kosakonia pseudosacchari TaxID=1646340 RepID=UPI001882659D|nr:rhodanese family protein [Kosakonia pseudosacchari]QOV63087.1 rhodanese family protein [Kosakonia pseudosacchari]